jgi:hypothetical protein
MDFPLALIGAAWLAILLMLAGGAGKALWRALLGSERELLDAIGACEACARKPVCETGALAGWGPPMSGCPNLKRLRARR